MKKTLQIGLVIVFFSLITIMKVNGQNYVIDPTADGSFEGTHGWTILNTDNVNKWIVGSAEKSSGSYGAYISNNNNTNTITNPQTANSKIYIYKDIIVPANATSISISFKYKNADTNAPAPRCLFEKTASFPGLPTNGIYTLVGAEFSTYLNNHSGWTSYTNSSPFTTDRPITYTSGVLTPGVSYRIVFEWSASYQTSYTQLPPFCTLPTSANITGNFTIAPNTTEIYNAVTVGGSNFGYTWTVTGGTIVSGQGTSQISIHYPLSFTAGDIRCSLGCDAPNYISAGKNSGHLAIDEVAISYIATPKITSFTQCSDSIGSSVTISGEYFGSSAANNIVYLNGIKCTITSATTTSVTVTVPPFATMGNFTVLNTTTNLICISANKFVPKNINLSGIGYSANTNTSFEPSVSFTTSMTLSSDQKFVMADIDNDGKLDVVSYSTAGVPQVLRNTSTSGVISSGTFATVSSISGVTPSFGGGNTSYNVLMADLNNDGKIDFASSNNANDGGFANINSSTSGSPALQNGTVITSSTSQYRVNRAFLPIDINLDGRIDIIGLTGNISQALLYYSKNTSVGNTFSMTTGNTLTTGSYNKQLSGGNFYSGAVGDINGDGKPDVVLGGTNQIYVLQNTTNQGTPDNKAFTFSEPLNKATVAGINYTVKLVDLDLDGKLDVITTNSTSPNVSVFKNNSTGSTTILGDLQNFNIPGFIGTFGLALGDMNGDGKPDIIVSDNVNQIAYLENTSTVGNISFATAVTIISGAAAYTQIEIADVDGDKKPDIIAASSSAIVVFRNRIGEVGTIGTDQTICYNTIPNALTSTTPASFSSGTITYKWQKSTTSATSGYSDIATTNTLGYTPTAQTATTWYKRAASSSTAPTVWYYTNPITITVTALPTVSSNTPASSCGANTTVSLAATASLGSINWYTASSGGTAIGSGSPWLTPSIAATTNYYAEAVTSNGCKSSSRTGVAATIITAIPTVSGTAASRCDVGIVTLLATPSPVYGATINWYASLTGGSSLGTGTSFITPSINTTTTYYVDATNCNGTTASRTAVIATVVNTPSVISTTPNSGCYNSTVSLSATASTGGSLYWYNVATGGSNSASYANVTAITANTTRYVSSYITSAGSTCESQRTAVVATIIPLPTVTATTPTTLCGLGTATISATPSAGTINWYSALTLGTLLGSGTSYTTPAIATTTTYYAVAVNSSGCVSANPRTAVAVTYNGATVGVISNLNSITNSTNQKLIASTLSGQTSFIWQRSLDNGNNWANITANLDAGVTYSGFSGTTATKDTLNISTALSAYHGNQYRLKLTKSAGCDNYSNTATFNVADVFGSCAAGTALTLVNANAGYTSINPSWYHLYGWDWNLYGDYTYTPSFATGYNSSFGSMTDGDKKSGLIVGTTGTGGTAYITNYLPNYTTTSTLINQVYLQGFIDDGWDYNTGG